MQTSDSCRSAEDLVYEYLRTAILCGEIIPDTSINQEEIARTLRVSRIPVRDAIRRLHSVGLVRILPNKRTVIPTFTPHEIFEIFEMRAVLEGVAARHAVANLTDADYSSLATMAEVMRAVSNLDLYLEHHEAFHDLIAARAEMPRLRREISRLREIVGPYIRISGVAHQTAEIEQDRHDSLLAVIKGRNPAVAEKALADHVRHAGRHLVAAVESLTGVKQSKKRSREQFAGNRVRRTGNIGERHAR